MRKIFLGLLVLLIVSGLWAQEENPLNDEFDDVDSLENWQFLHDVEGWADMIKTLDVRDGSLYLEPYTTGWYADYHGPMMFQDVTGDFVVTSRLKVTGVEDEIPGVAWSLAGLIARAPRDVTPETWTPRGENWVFITTGIADRLRSPVFETKTTVNSRSVLELHRARSGWVELRLARIGDHYLLLQRLEGETEWTMQEHFVRDDMPETLQVGFIVYTDWFSMNDLTAEAANNLVITDGKPDVVLWVDYAHFETVSLPEDFDVENADDDEWITILPE